MTVRRISYHETIVDLAGGRRLQHLNLVSPHSRSIRQFVYKDVFISNAFSDCQRYPEFLCLASDVCEWLRQSHSWLLDLKFHTSVSIGALSDFLHRGAYWSTTILAFTAGH